MNKLKQVATIPNSLVLLKIQIFCKEKRCPNNTVFDTNIELAHKGTNIYSVIEKVVVQLKCSKKILSNDSNNLGWFEANVFLYIPSFVNQIGLCLPSGHNEIKFRVLPIFIKPNECDSFSSSINSINDFLSKKYSSTISPFFNTKSALEYIDNVVLPMKQNYLPELDIKHQDIGRSSLKKSQNIAFMDNLQANGNQLTFVTVNQLNSFDLLPYYKYFTNDKYAEMHIEHNFRGAILSKIPLLNRLNFHIVAGGKGLFMADKNPYTESAIGLSNIGFGKWRFLRIDYVHSNYGGIKNEGLVFKISMFN